MNNDLISRGDLLEAFGEEPLRYVRERVRRIETIIKRLDFLLKEDGNAD